MHPSAQPYAVHLRIISFDHRRGLAYVDLVDGQCLPWIYHAPWHPDHLPRCAVVQGGKIVRMEAE